MSDLTSHYRSLDVPVRGGDLRVGCWDGSGGPSGRPTLLAVHGVTANHLAWPWLARHTQYDVVAPDLRGRGCSGPLPGPAGMRQHAEDLLAVVDHLHLDEVVVVGHSMGGFVATAFAELVPERVSSVVLVDGGLPFPPPPPGVTPEQAVAAIIGPAAERLRMTFADTDAYLDFWRDHPALSGGWSPEVEAYLAHDLVGDPPERRSSVSLQAVREDSADLLEAEPVVRRVQALPEGTAFLRAPNGMMGKPGGLYPADLAARHQQEFGQLRFHEVEGTNHYTIVMSDTGARAIAATLPN